MSRIASAALKFTHKTDPAENIRQAAGDLTGYKVYGPRILVGVYEPPKDGMVGSIIVPDMSGGTKDEYKWQGRVCLVLKKGTIAFKDDEDMKFGGDDVNEGDWVVINALDGRSTLVGSQLCRLVNDHHIQMVVPHPDAVL